MTDRRASAVVGEGCSLRVDRFIAETMSCLSRSQIKSRGARIRVNGRPAKPSHELKAGDEVEVVWTEAAPPALHAQDIPLDILYEDDRVVVVNKAAGMVTHPANGHWEGTLVNALLGRMRFPAASDGAATGLGSTRDPSAPFRPGIVHRLDRDTSGVIIVAKDESALEFLAAQFRDRRTVKSYMAIVRGRVPGTEGRIEGWMARDPADRKRFALGQGIAGKHSLTLWRLRETFSGGYALLSLRPRTGRTHQLRVHLRSIGCPILGDPVYGSPDPRFPAAGLMLHAHKLRIRLPGEEDDRLFCAPLPPAFQKVLDALRKGDGASRRT